MNICVFCSSANNLNEKYQTTARQLGEKIAKGNHQLVYGGAKVGLMHIVAENTRNHGAQTIGIVAQVIKNNNVASSSDDQQFITPTMHERKALMREKSDAVIALPGGFGTLEELLEVLTLKQLGEINIPVVIFNIDHYYDHLIDQFKTAVKDGFSKEAYLGLYLETTSIDDAFEYIETYRNTSDKTSITKWN
ncbi:TIGR00730 family Rossman fold protein [Halosquirtibacter xylanolyticus]|uniref:LOG family protein n=1 Tax=Halosquirtibacter xylanolyticus TaxID=3374599 RepID=UPI00374A3D5E|nr:TIGR00730 family Rossman fold protein [Prolixibacteraceae bacterium]